MSRHDYKFKLRIVKENLEGYGQKYLSKKYGLKNQLSKIG